MGSAGLAQLIGGVAELVGDRVGCGRVGTAGLFDDGFEVLVGEFGQGGRVAAVEGGGGSLPPGSGVGTAGAGGSGRWDRRCVGSRPKASW